MRANSTFAALHAHRVRMGTVRRFASISLLLTIMLYGGCDSSPLPVNSGEEEEPLITTPVEHFKTIDTAPDWSPDGQTIAYTHYPVGEEEAKLHRGPQVWLLDLESGKRRFLTPGWRPDWSPDGATLTYIGGGGSGYVSGDICTIDVETEETKRLTRCGVCFNPSWSPDGERIAYDAVFRGDSSGVWVTSADGSEKEHLLTSGRAPDWSPEGGRIVFTRMPADPPHNESDLFMLDLESQEVSRLTESIRRDRHPVWSSTGDIAWESYGGKDFEGMGIWAMNGDGTERRRLTERGGRLSWSPDGEQIVFYREYDEETGTLWLMNRDGSNQRPLTTPDDYPVAADAAN